MKRKRGHPFFGRQFIQKDHSLLSKKSTELSLEEYAKLAAVIVEGHKKYEIEEYTKELNEYVDQLRIEHENKVAQSAG